MNNRMGGNIVAYLHDFLFIVLLWNSRGLLGSFTSSDFWNDLINKRNMKENITLGLNCSTLLHFKGSQASRIGYQWVHLSAGVCAGQWLHYWTCWFLILKNSPPTFFYRCSKYVIKSQGHVITNSSRAYRAEHFVCTSAASCTSNLPVLIRCPSLRLDFKSK